MSASLSKNQLVPLALQIAGEPFVSPKTRQVLFKNAALREDLAAARDVLRGIVDSLERLPDHLQTAPMKSTIEKVKRALVILVEACGSTGNAVGRPPLGLPDFAATIGAVAGYVPEPLTPDQVTTLLYELSQATVRPKPAVVGAIISRVKRNEMPALRNELRQIADSLIPLLPSRPSTETWQGTDRLVAVCTLAVEILNAETRSTGQPHGRPPQAGGETRRPPVLPVPTVSQPEEPSDGRPKP